MKSDKVEGYLEIGTNDSGEVVINLPEDKTGHIVFSPNQARNLGNLLHKHADRLDPQQDEGPKDAVSSLVQEHRFSLNLPVNDEGNDAGYIKRGDVSIQLEWIGEGNSGDYDKDDPDDEPLLRFTVYHKGEPLEDASYCTQVPANATLFEKFRVLVELMDAVYDAVVNNKSTRRLCERLSWITKNGMPWPGKPEDINEP